jgi:hypothetical protein
MHDYDVIRKWERAVALEIDGAELVGKNLDEGNDQSPSLRARVIAGIVVGAMQPVFAKWYEEGGAFDLVAVGDRALDVAARGVKSVEDDFLP